MLIEDDPGGRDLLCDVLTSQGCICRSFESAELALEALSHWQPHLILMDINLPGMDGIAATRQIKRNPDTSDIPVIAMSAHAMSQELSKFENVGFEQIFTKPYSYKLVIENLKKVLHSNVDKH